jgi:predicted ester cyclase
VGSGGRHPLIVEDIVRVANGQIVEHWLGQDSLALFRQLGVQLSPPS